MRALSRYAGVLFAASRSAARSGLVIGLALAMGQ